MTKDFAKEEERLDEGVPVCDKCGNLMIKDSDQDYLEGSFGDAPDKTRPQAKEKGSALWVCPHCQGEIDFLGEDEDE